MLCCAHCCQCSSKTYCFSLHCLCSFFFFFNLSSLFPKHELLNEHTLLVGSILNSPKLPPKRITLTYPVINGARHVLFVAAGGSKAENLPKVIPSGSTMSNNGGGVMSIGNALDESGKEDSLPAARVRPTAGSLHFYVDEDAASLLSPGSDL